MKTNFITPNGVDILKTQKAVDCPFFENPDAFSWCKRVGLFVDPATLPARATGRDGGFFGVANGRQYAFPVEFTISTRADAISRADISFGERVLEVPEYLGGGFVIDRPGLPSAIEKMIHER